MHFHMFVALFSSDSYCNYNSNVRNFNAIWLRCFLSKSKHADVKVLTLNQSYRGHILPHVDYKTLSGDEPLYRENDELVSEEDLRDLNLSRMDYRIYP